jgi:hypothetical protein
MGAARHQTRGADLAAGVCGLHVGHVRPSCIVMPVTTAAAAYHIAPVVIKTFIQHTRKKTHKLTGWNNEETATDDLFYDECVSDLGLNMAQN